MNQSEIKFCLKCGAEGVITREVTPNHVLELMCPHCGTLALLLWREQELVGTKATHDADSDAEAW